MVPRAIGSTCDDGEAPEVAPDVDPIVVLVEDVDFVVDGLLDMAVDVVFESPGSTAV